MTHRVRTVVLSVLPLCCALLTSCIPQDMLIEGDGSGYVIEPQIEKESSQREVLDEDSTESPDIEQPSSDVTATTSEVSQLVAPAIPPNQDQASSILEHTGTKTSWEALRVKVTQEIDDHQRHIQQLNLKLQLIDQIATKLELTTKAQLRKNHSILADFAITNPTTYALKDISISCDQIAPTGTKISTHSETIYAIVDANATQSFAGVELDQLHKQTKSLNCEIKNFTVHTQ
ncbi:MAG: hypothetical protein ACPGYT_14510 [Nitrospirales bacterium]